jgi:dTDP-4-dehydrorhamnose 3,5-epimerase
MIEPIRKPIDGVIVRPLIRHLDTRGYLTELWRADDEALPLPAMAYLSWTAPGMIRGFHIHPGRDFQPSAEDPRLIDRLAADAQSDTFLLDGPGNFRLVIFDARTQSPTFKHLMDFVAGEDKPTLVIVPPGTWHGYMALEKRGMVINLPDQLYAGAGRKRMVDEVRMHPRTQDLFRFDWGLAED